MDRIKLLSILMVASLLLPASLSIAGTVLAPRVPDTTQSPDERYPESRFGQQPSRVDLGVGPSYVRHAVSELDPVRDEIGDARSERPVRRSPAGLESSDQARAMPGSTDSTPSASHYTRPDGTREAPVRAETGMQDPQPSTINRSGVQEVALIASDLGYFPRTIFVTRDLPVRLFVTGASKNTLCIMMDSFQVRKQVRSQKIEEITFTPNVPGKYRFYCPVNGMEGTLIVKEYTTGLDTAWASTTNQ